MLCRLGRSCLSLHSSYNLFLFYCYLYVFIFILALVYFLNTGVCFLLYELFVCFLNIDNCIYLMQKFKKRSIMKSNNASE